MHSTKVASAASILQQTISLMKSLCNVLRDVGVLSDNSTSRGISDASAWERGLVLVLVVLCNAHGGLRSSATLLVGFEQKVSLATRLKRLGGCINGLFLTPTAKL
jgi:hypothetical protein